MKAVIFAITVFSISCSVDAAAIDTNMDVDGGPAVNPTTISIEQVTSWSPDISVLRRSDIVFATGEYTRIGAMVTTTISLSWVNLDGDPGAVLELPLPYEADFADGDEWFALSGPCWYTRDGSNGSSSWSPVIRRGNDGPFGYSIYFIDLDGNSLTLGDGEPRQIKVFARYKTTGRLI